MWLETAKVAGLLLALFICAGLGTYCVGRLTRRAAAAPPVNTRIRLRQGGAQFACYLVEAGKNHWTVTLPVQVSGVAPLRPAQEYLCDFVRADGLAVFWSRVLGRPANNAPYLRIASPSRIQVRDRRAHSRMKFNSRQPALLNGLRGVWVTDLGCGGAGLAMVRPLTAGSDVELRLTSTLVSLRGVVLACGPSSREHAPYAARIRFDDHAPLEFVTFLTA